MRNRQRPFAAPIFASLPGQTAILESDPTRFDSAPPPDLTADDVYLMLHGADTDATTYWGEGDAGIVEAIHVSNVPGSGIGVVLAGCCWGALTVHEMASKPSTTVAPTPRPTEASIALSLLAAGALAFVGCTGAHYSPTQANYAYFGGPLHQSFWDGVHKQGRAPAQALFDAKTAFAQAMPHGQTSPIGEAIERKIFYEFTCLGLGW